MIQPRKQPLGPIEAPVWPDIKKGPKRFVWAKKTSKVDIAKTVLDIEDHPDMWDHAVLTRNWDEGKQHKYGRRPTYTTAVNQNFRPPPEDLEDFLPLSRGKRPTVFGRINPSGGYYHAQNTSLSQVEGWLERPEKVKRGLGHSGFSTKVSRPQENPQNYWLDRNTPSHSVSAGERHRRVDAIEEPDLYLESNLPQYSLHSGYAHASVFNLEDPGWELEKNVPEHSVSARSSSRHYFQPMHITPIEGTNNPRVSASAGFAHPSLAEDLARSVYGFHDFDLQDRSPVVSAHAGFRTRVTAPEEDPEWELERNHPSYSAGSGYHYQTRDNITETGKLKTRVKEQMVRGSYRIPESQKNLAPNQRLKPSRGIDHQGHAIRKQHATPQYPTTRGKGDQSLFNGRLGGTKVRAKPDAMRPRMAPLDRRRPSKYQS